MSDTTDPIPRPALAELLTAICDALDVPLADDHKDHQQALDLLRTRSCYVRGAIGRLASGAPGYVDATTAAVREAINEYPVTYAPYGARDAQRHQLYDAAVPPLAVDGPDLAEITARVAAIGAVAL